MRSFLFVPAVIIMLMVRAVSHTLEFIWPVRPVRAVADASARILRELINGKTKRQTGAVVGQVVR